MSLNCNDIQKQMQSLKTLKNDFDIVFEDAKTNPSVEAMHTARALKRQIQESLEAIKQPLLHHVAEQGTLLDHPLFAENIAHNIEEIDERTRVYIGPLKSDIFKHLPLTTDYIYTKYPEGRFHFTRESLQTGSYDVKQLKQMLTEQGHTMSNDANTLLNTPTFKQSLHTDSTCAELKEPETLNLIHITPEQLGFPQGATTQQIFDRAQELGLQLCPPSVGPYYRLQYTDQPLYEGRIIGMNPIDIGVGGDLDLFGVLRNADGPWLRTYGGGPDDQWGPGNHFVFIASSS